MLRWWDGVTRALLAAAGVVLLPVLWVPNFLVTWTIPSLMVWDILALAFLARQVWSMRRGRKAADAEGTPDWLLSARLMRLRYGALLVASAAGLSSGMLIVSVDAEDDGTQWDVWIIRLLAATTVVLAWLILHVGYAMHYANLYFGTGHGVTFPGTSTPNFLDFAYFAFTIGATFATSDVEVTNRRVRHAVIWHSVLSFFYNAAVLGIAIGAFTGK
ncbi:DUF1345 domain-containing protein [Kribbella albertanoniae]|uniref:DUF1345 domain-containing protein n=1 Tax=Kribbella albertanoniae TaxID=1266829 RepID=A0A4R4P3W5_9ACTN|nr:DUF1345 domain-containing protein [Kribbella albertanoniae]TDC15380.1 DUF1345 domain-containing protein [Kribbella albertanoniae]